MALLVPALLAEIPKGERCLEIGIGTGRIALPLVRAGVAIAGVDISREMLRRLVIKAASSQLQIAVADATRLPFREHSFASAIAAHVLHLIPNWAIAVEELLRVVRPGGTILASRGGGGRAGGWGRKVSRHFFIEAGDPTWPPGIDRIEELDAHMRTAARGCAHYPSSQSKARRASTQSSPTSRPATFRAAGAWTNRRVSKLGRRLGSGRTKSSAPSTRPAQPRSHPSGAPTRCRAGSGVPRE